MKKTNNPDPFKPTRIFNPDIRPFTVTYDLNGDSKPISYTIPSQEIAEFPFVVAEHIKKHLAQHLTMKRGWKGSNYEEQLAKNTEEIEVNL